MEAIGTAQLPSVINDPFSKNKVKRIYISVSEFRERWSANGSIEFENGNTKGEQKFSGATFDDVVLQIKACLDSLNSIHQ